MRLAGMMAVTIGCLIAALLLAGSALADDALVINDGNAFTNSVTVTITLPPPTDDSSLVRMSNDGAEWGSPMPWQGTMTWDLSDAATGGTGDDGQKTVYAQYDDGSNNWHDAGTGSITLDRTAPTGGFCGESTSGWIIHPCWNAVDPNFGIAAAEFELDNGPWTPIGEVGITGIDARTPYLGGSWNPAGRRLCYRATDPAGNVGAPICDYFGLVGIPEVTGLNTANENWDVRFDFPLPAITGSLYTISPRFPTHFPVMPDDALCDWILQWGDKDNFGALPNDDFGSVEFKKLFKDGGCEAWTFTLPYTPGGYYQFSLQIRDGWAGKRYFTSSWNSTTFAATEGTHERGIPTSTHGLAYIIPDQFMTQPGDPVTYHLHYSTGATDDITQPKKAYWWADNNECEHNIGSNTPSTVLTFTYVPDCQGPWETGWTWENNTTHEYLRAEFDPAADKAPPKVTAPQAQIVAGTPIGAAVPVTLHWSGVDPVVKEVSTGLVAYNVQVCRNGGSWKNVTLPTRAATSVQVNLLPTGSYRFRVRATDAVGNRSTWATGPLLHPKLKQQGSATLAGGWSTVTRTTLSGGSAAVATTSGASALLTFAGRSISLIGSVGPSSGLAQVYVDGALTQTLDLGNATAVDQKVLFTKTWAASATHTVRVVVLGTSGRPTITLDSFVVVS